jgi:hypothetical protein
MQLAMDHSPAPYHLDLHLEPDENTLSFVRQRFAHHHGAVIQTLLPWQCILRDEQGKQLASAGLNPAAAGPLFLEHYLSSPVEQQLASGLQHPVVRDDILEVGNLAAWDGHARLLILSLIRYLAEQRYRYVVFTATDQVRALFRALGLRPVDLEKAVRERVPQPELWGRYYEHDPKVVAGDIRLGYQQLQAHPKWQATLQQLPRCEQRLPRQEV